MMFSHEPLWGDERETVRSQRCWKRYLSQHVMNQHHHQTSSCQTITNYWAITSSAVLISMEVSCYAKTISTDIVIISFSQDRALFEWNKSVINMKYRNFSLRPDINIDRCFPLRRLWFDFDQKQLGLWDFQVSAKPVRRHGRRVLTEKINSGKDEATFWFQRETLKSRCSVEIYLVMWWWQINLWQRWGKTSLVTL